MESKNNKYKITSLFTKFGLVFFLLNANLTHPIHTCITKVWIKKTQITVEHIIPTEDLLNNPTINWSSVSRNNFEEDNLTQNVKAILETYLADNFILTINSKNIPLKLNAIKVNVFETSLFCSAKSSKRVKNLTVYNSLNMFLEGIENTTLVDLNGENYSSFHSNIIKSQNIKFQK